MKQWLAGLVMVVISATSASAGVSIQEMHQIVSQLLQHSAHKPQVQIYVDAQRAMGRAAVFGNPMQAVIFVDPQAMSRHHRTTWAFWLGHELGHPLIPRPGGTPQAERACDEFGAHLAIAAGYKLDVHLQAMYQAPSIHVCSPTHGCEIDRARNLQQKFGTGGPSAPSGHEAHPPWGAKTPSCWTQSGACAHPNPCVVPGATQGSKPAPCSHRVGCADFGCSPVPCAHQAPCGHGVCPHKQACFHGPVPCQHPVMTPVGMRPAHPQGDSAHEFHLQHPQGCMPAHPQGHPVHPQGDAPHQNGHVLHPGGHGGGSMPAPVCLR